MINYVLNKRTNVIDFCVWDAGLMIPGEDFRFSSNII